MLTSFRETTRHVRLDCPYAMVVVDTLARAVALAVGKPPDARGAVEHESDESVLMIVRQHLVRSLLPEGEKIPRLPRWPLPFLQQTLRSRFHRPRSVRWWV